MMSRLAPAPPNDLVPKGLTLSDEVLTEAASRFGTPLFVYDATMLRRSWHDLRKILPKPVSIHYSVKANPSIAVIDTFHQLGSHFEVASAGELAAVLRVGVPASKVIFVGPGKSRSEITGALAHGVGAIVVESPGEFATVRTLASNVGVPARVALRVNPGLAALVPGAGRGTLAMGGTTQFGMSPEDALSLLRNSGDDLQIVGLHAFLGTRILDWRVIVANTDLVLRTAAELQAESGRELEFIDVGGGFGIPCYEHEQVLNLELLEVGLAASLSAYLAKHPWTQTIAVEAGRFLVAASGVFLGRVLDVKSMRGQCFAILDGGVNVLGGRDGYMGARAMPMRLVGRNDVTEPQTICGPLCTPTDRLAALISFPKLQVGDLVAFYIAGAYAHSASPGRFLSHGYPAEAFVDGSLVSIVRDRESPEQILANQRLPNRATQHSMGLL
jgi:diaminopimelate decarboxylase